jgi:hypothetical protein
MGGVVIVVLLLAQALLSVFGLPGPKYLATGWHDSTPFERLVLIAAVLACAWLLPSILRAPVDRLRSRDVVKVLAYEIGVAALPLAVLAAPDDASTVLGWLSDGWGALGLQAVLAAVVVALVLARWVQANWAVAGTLAAGAAVVAAELAIHGMASAGLPRALMLLAVAACLVVLIALLQVIGVGRTGWVLTAWGMAGMVIGACLVAAVGQLLFQPFGRIGVPLGLWQGMFCAAVITIFVQPIPPPQPSEQPAIEPEQPSHTPEVAAVPA